jgi:hypothetical protein
MKQPLLALLLLGLPACGIPSRDITPQPGDFALIEVQLRG